MEDVTMMAFGATVQMTWMVWGIVAVMGVAAIGILTLVDRDELVWLRPWRFNRLLKAAMLPGGFMCPAHAR